MGALAEALFSKLGVPTQVDRAVSLQERLQAMREQADQAQQRAAAQQEAAAAPGLMQELWRRGMPQMQANGEYTTPWNPAMASATNLLANPATRSIGVKQAIDLLNPQTGADLALSEAQRRKWELDAQKTQQEMEQNVLMGPLERQSTLALIAERKAAAAASLQNALLASQGRINAKQFKLNDTFLQQIKDPNEVANAVMQVDGALAGNDSLGALAAVIKFAKIMDPRSVVREGEVATAYGGLGTAEHILAEWNKLQGGGLSENGKKRFREVVRQVAGPVLANGMRIENEIRTSAKVMEVDPEQSIRGAGWPSRFVQGYLKGAADPNATADYEF